MKILILLILLFFPWNIIEIEQTWRFQNFIFSRRKLKKCKASNTELLSVHLHITIQQTIVMKRLRSLTTETIFSDFGWDKSSDYLVQHKETKEQLYLMQTSKATRRRGFSPTYPSYLPEKSCTRKGGHSWKSWNHPHIPLYLLPLWNSAQTDQFLL